MNTSEAVAKAAEIFDKAEQRARTTKTQFRQLRKLFEVIRDDGHVGGLECQAVAGKCDALVTKFEADIWALHRELTVRARDLGIDIPSTLRDGGDR